MKNVAMILFIGVSALGMTIASSRAFAGAAALPEVVKESSTLSLRGEGSLKFLGFKVYDAQLWTPQKRHSAADVFALQLVYDMAFKGREIAERTVGEMRKVGYGEEQKLKRWGEEMMRVFPDVKKGDTLVGVSIPGKGVKYYSRDKLIGSIDDAEFVKAFFDVWLSEKTSEPKLREKLLGAQ
jgi:hypothetical protein